MKRTSKQKKFSYSSETKVVHPKEIYMFLSIFFSKTEELELSLTFIKNKIGEYEYFSHNIRHEDFPLKDELFSIFYSGHSLQDSKYYYNKLIGISSPTKIKKLSRYLTKIKKFQRKVLSEKNYQIPIHFGYLSNLQIISIYKRNGFVSVTDAAGLHHQMELNYINTSFNPHSYSLSLFRTKAYLTFFNDFKRLMG